VSKSKRTIATLSYGLSCPRDLLEKLKFDADRLSHKPQPYEIFNFIVTAAVLGEWIQKYYSDKSDRPAFRRPQEGNAGWTLPAESAFWISDASCIPNPESGVERHISNVLSICAFTADASKHFHWCDKGAVSEIGSDPPIGNWSQYFFTSTSPDIYLTYRGENYGLQQIKGIIVQFYTALIVYFDAEDASMP